MAAPALDSLSISSESPQTFRVLVISGDHVGPEVMDEAMRVLDIVEITSQGRLKFDLNHQLAGGCSIDKHGKPVTDEVLRIAKEESDAVLFGSVGGPKW